MKLTLASLAFATLTMGMASATTVDVTVKVTVKAPAGVDENPGLKVVDGVLDAAGVGGSRRRDLESVERQLGDTVDVLVYSGETVCYETSCDAGPACPGGQSFSDRPYSSIEPPEDPVYCTRTIQGFRWTKATYSCDREYYDTPEPLCDYYYYQFVFEAVSDDPDGAGPETGNGVAEIIFKDGTSVTDPVALKTLDASIDQKLGSDWETKATIGETGKDKDSIKVAAEGDPHFKTWSGEWFDYMGACDLKFIHAPKFDGETPLDINVRTKIRHDWSYIENAVLKLGEDTFEVASFGDYWLNGVMSAKLPATVGGYSVTYNNPSKKLHIFTIHISDTETLVMKSFKDMVAVTFKGMNVNRFQGSLGMVGSFDKAGKLIARDGVTEITDTDAFANEWQIRQDEPMIFHTASGPQHPEKCQLPDPTQSKGRRLGETIALEAAEKACAKYAPENVDACVHDVMAIGDLDLAAAGAV